MSELETQLATAQQTLAQAEADAAALRAAISRYLTDVTLGPTVLADVLWETDAGVEIESELHALRDDCATLTRKLLARDLQVEQLTAAYDDLWARLVAPWYARLWSWMRGGGGR